VTHWSAFCAFTHQRRKSSGCIAFRKRGARRTQCFREFGVSFTQRFRLWQERAARKRKWKSGGDGGAQRCNAGTEKCGEE
jgi:hypothetical protein